MSALISFWQGYRAGQKAERRRIEKFVKEIYRDVQYQCKQAQKRPPSKWIDKRAKSNELATWGHLGMQALEILKFVKGESKK